MRWIHAIGLQIIYNKTIDAEPVTRRIRSKKWFLFHPKRRFFLVWSTGAVEIDRAVAVVAVLEDWSA